MTHVESLSVELIAWPQFRVPDSLRDRYALENDVVAVESLYDPAVMGGGTDLVEFAGRACYQSWSRPNPKTATNEGYLAHILEVGHHSVLEHASYTFYVQGVSRSLTHELVRHRHLSFSQLSQRYVDGSTSDFVMPPLFQEGVGLYALARDRVAEMHAAAVENYEDLTKAAEAMLQLDQPELSATARRKAARQAARAVLPNMTETKIVVTGNLRAWRHFIALRATEHADVEIRAMAFEVYRLLRAVATNAMQDASPRRLDDGSYVVEGIGTEEESTR